MNILIATQTFGSHTNGQGVFTTNLAEGLAKNGHQVMVIMPSEKFFSYREIRKNVCIQAVRAIPLAPYYPDVHVTLVSGPLSTRTIDEFHPDIVHIQDHYPLCRGVVEAAIKRGIPLVATNHFLPANIIHNVPLFHHYRNFFKDTLWSTVLQTYNQADVITVPTETAADILRQQSVHTPVKAITCGVNLRRYHPDPHINRVEVRKRYGLDPERVIFMYVGRIDQEKGVDTLIHAFHHLNRNDIQLALAGKGIYAEEMHRMVKELNLDQEVVFTGFVPEQDLPSLLNSVDFFAMPSDAELQSIATLEAMGTGLPVLAANARALPELVRHGVNGYLFKPDDVEDAAKHIEKLVEMREDWDSMKAAGLEIVRPHHISNMVEKYTELYLSVLERSAH